MYFLVFVDFSRMSSVYLLKNMIEVIDVIKIFCNTMKTQFSTSFHILRKGSTYIHNESSNF